MCIYKGVYMHICIYMYIHKHIYLYIYIPARVSGGGGFNTQTTHV